MTNWYDVSTPRINISETLAEAGVVKVKVFYDDNSSIEYRKKPEDSGEEE
jgi:hypothetical protein